jgi:hypothetical protein
MSVVARVGLAGAALAIAACTPVRGPGSFDTPDPNNTISTKLGNLLAFNRTSSPAAVVSPAGRATNFCPEIVILDGTAAQRFYASAQTNQDVRYQYSVNDVARSCEIEGSQLAMKVGIAGKVLLGPAGAPGSFSVPVRVAVVRESDQKPLTSNLYHADVTVVQGQTEAPFTIITDPLLVPSLHEHNEDDYIIKVGIDSAPAKPQPAAKGRPKS